MAYAHPHFGGRSPPDPAHEVRLTNFHPCSPAYPTFTTAASTTRDQHVNVRTYINRTDPGNQMILPQDSHTYLETRRAVTPRSAPEMAPVSTHVTLSNLDRTSPGPTLYHF